MARNYEKEVENAWDVQYHCSQRNQHTEQEEEEEEGQSQVSVEASVLPLVWASELKHS